MSNRRTVAVLPAAGASQRMGRPKLLLPLRGHPLVAGVVEALREGGVGEIVLVTAAGDEELRAWARGAGLTVAINPDPERGMLSSIRAGIAALGGADELVRRHETLLVSPADLPNLRAATVSALLARLAATGAPIAVPVYRGRRGHPLAIAPALIPEIDGLDPEVGLKQLRDRHAAALLEIEVDDAGVVQDVDTPEDYERLRGMPTMEELSLDTEHERVLFCRDPAAGYRGVIAIHSTAAGPAAGGTRFWAYASEEEAVTDALRLSRGMTYKNAMAGLPLGGGKSVILRDGTEDREAIFRAHGRFIERLQGRYLTGEDVGTSPADMEIVRQETRHVAGATADPSPFTARGVLRAMRAAALHRWGSEDLAGRTIALQGCGNVGFHLAGELAAAAARLVVTDVDPERVRKTLESTGARAVPPEEIYEVAADVFAPCALGGVLNGETIPRLRAEIVAGAANNQLLAEVDGERLLARDILYAPDYVANSGGVIFLAGREVLGWSDQTVRVRIEAIFDTTLALLRLAEEQRVPPHVAADRLAERRLAAIRDAATPDARTSKS